MKKILYVLVGLVALYLILCLIGPSISRAERSIVIAKPNTIVLPKLADLKFFHDSWSPWTEKDPNMKTTYTGECCVPGNSMSWESDNKEVGKGTMTFEKFSGDSVLQTIHFDGMGDSKVYFTAVNQNAETKVTWGMTSTVPFIGRGFMLFMNMDKMLGPDFEKGLSKLKVALESMSDDAKMNYEIEELAWDAKTFYGIKENVTFDKLPAFFGKSYGMIGAAIGKTKAQPIGQPKAIYFTFDEKNMSADVAAVMEFANGTKVDGVDKFETPAAKVLHIAYYGAYEKSNQAHYAMDNYMKEKGLNQSFVIEEYVTDPMTEKDTAKWLTNIFYLVK